jgi:integrase
MRHTFASLLLQDGAPILDVSRQLGHRDAAITLRVYPNSSFGSMMAWEKK